jgi:hypothetical protein
MKPAPAASRAILGDIRALLRIAPAIAALALAPAVALAAEPALSLAEALRLAVARSPQLASQRAMVEAAREMAGPAGELPDPKLKLGFENVPTDGPDRWSLTRDFMTMSKIGVMQEFPREEKRRLRSQRAERDAERGTVAVESARLAVQRETATAWLARRFAADTERMIAEQIAEAELAMMTVAAAYRAGRVPQGELLGAQTMVVELKNRDRGRRADAARNLPSRAISAPMPSARRARLPTSHALRSIRRGSPMSMRNRRCAWCRRRKPWPQPTPISRVRQSSPTGARRSRTRYVARRTRTWCR